MAIEILVQMKDEVTSAAKSAASSLLGLQSASKGLSGMGSAIAPLGEGALSSAQKIATLKSAMTSLEKANLKIQATSGGVMDEKTGAKFAANADKIEQLKASLSGITPEAAKSTSAMEQLAAGTMEVGGPIAIAVAGYSALGAAIGGMVVEGAKLSLELSEAKEKTVAAFDALSKGGKSGQAALSMIRDLADKLPQTRGELQGWAKDLMAVGVTDMHVLQGRLEAIASAQAMLGGEAADKVKKKFEDIANAAEMGTKLKVSKSYFDGLGVSADDVASKMGISSQKMQAMLKTGEVDAKKFGDAMQAALIEKGKGPLEAMSGSLSVMSSKLMEAFRSMFSGVDVKPFVAGLKEISDMLIKAMGGDGKKAVTSFFNAFFAAATAVLPFVKWALTGIVSVVKVVGPIVSAVAKAFAWVFNAAGGTRTLTTALKGLAVVVGLLAVGAAIVVAPFMLIFVAIGLVVGILGALVAVAAIVIGTLVNLASSAVDALGEFASAASDAAGNFISGLVGGITGGVGDVVGAMRGLATSAVGAFKQAMGINSPSRVMMQMGHHTTAGLTGGVESGVSSVAKAGAGLSDALQAGVNSPGTAAGSDAAPAPKGAPSGAQGGKGTKGGVTVNVEAGAIVIQGAGGDVMALTEDALARLLERVALTQGLT